MPNIRTLLFFGVSVAVLFLDFYADGLGVAGDDFSNPHQIVLESFVIGRMVKSGRDGVFSAGGLLGLVGPDPAPPDIEQPNYQFQSAAYLNSLPFQSYAAYPSQNGAQGALLGALDSLLPLSPADRISAFHAVNSLLAALVLSAVVVWFFREWGAAAGALALAGTALSQWLVVFAHSLWWSTWAFFLPMAIFLYALRRIGNGGRMSMRRFGAAVFLAVLLKCLFNGFEYITTTLIMMTVPLVYYAGAGNLGGRKFFRAMLAAIAGALLAVLFSMAVLCVQIYAVTGSLSAGVNHIVLSLLRRSYADPGIFPADYRASLTAGTVDVVMTYLKGIFLDLNRYIPAPGAWVANYLFQVRYIYLILVFAAASALLLLFLRSEKNADLRSVGRPSVAALWFSLLAPLSWLILFKAHSYVHTFMNNIVWQMPFTIFGFAVCGLTVRAAARILRKNTAGRNPCL